MMDSKYFDWDYQFNLFRRKKMDLPLSFDRRGKEGSPAHDPEHYVITDRFGRILCDTLNCDSSFTIEEQQEIVANIVMTMNREHKP